jgi:hypothetical protein
MLNCYLSLRYFIQSNNVFYHFLYITSAIIRKGESDGNSMILTDVISIEYLQNLIKLKLSRSQRPMS